MQYPPLLDLLRAARVGGGALLAAGHAGHAAAGRAAGGGHGQGAAHVPHPRRWGGGHRRHPLLPEDRRQRGNRAPGHRRAALPPARRAAGGADRPLCRDGRPGHAGSPGLQGSGQAGTTRPPWTPGCPWSTSSTRPMAFPRPPPSRPWRPCGSRPGWIPWPSWQKNPADADASAGFHASPLRRRGAAACPAPPPRSPAAGPRAAPPRRPPNCRTG